MARPKVDSPATPVEEAAQPAEVQPASTLQNGNSAEPAATLNDPDQIDEVFKHLKTLLSTVEKLQKARQDVGDIKPQLLRLLDGELLDGEDLEQLKSGVNGLSKLVKLYSDYQTALAEAQPAREMLDSVLK
jgi:hypothetical protein